MAGLPVPSPAPISDADYEAIEAAVVETTRGRWFLAEYARRNRQAETKGLIDVLQRIEAKIEAPRHDPQLDRVRMSIMEMAQAIARTKDEIAAIKPTQEVEGRFGEATEELDAIVTTTETATDDILRAAEQIQEVAWTLRERGFEGPICDMLDERATDIYTACSFQDLTGQRTRKVIGVLRYLEARINAMIDIWGVDPASVQRAQESAKTAKADDRPLGRKLAHGPARLGEGLGQDVVDNMLGPEVSADDAFAGLSIDDIMAAEVAEFVAVSVHDAEPEVAETAGGEPAALPQETQELAQELAQEQTLEEALENAEIVAIEVAEEPAEVEEIADAEVIDATDEPAEIEDIAAIEAITEAEDIVDIAEAETAEVTDIAEAEDIADAETVEVADIETAETLDASAADEPAPEVVDVEVVDVEVVDIEAIGDIANIVPVEAAADEAAGKNFDIDAALPASGRTETADEAVPHATDAPSIATELDLRIVEALASDALDELIAVDVPVLESEDDQEAAGAPAEQAATEHPIVPALPAEPSAVRLSTADIDQLTPAERTALFT